MGNVAEAHNFSWPLLISTTILLMFSFSFFINIFPYHRLLYVKLIIYYHVIRTSPMYISIFFSKIKIFIIEVNLLMTL